MITDDTNLLQFADYLFLAFHTALILFNLFGWIFRPLRKIHMLVISLTFASWGILGIWYGWGYCPLTDWHWNILYQLGHRQLPESYISYLLDRILDLQIPDNVVDSFTFGLALVALLASVKINYFSLEK